MITTKGVISLSKIKINLVTILMISISALVWIPLFMVITGSFMGKSEVTDNLAVVLKEGDTFAHWSIIPKYPTLQPYFELLLDSPRFFVMFWNSCKQVFASLLMQLLVGVPAAWSFAKLKFKGKKIIFTIYIILMIMPFQVTMVSNYLMLSRLDLIDTYWAVILPNAFSTFPVFIMTKFFKDIPEVLIEAAKIDGANEMNTFIYIGIPMGKAGILSALVLGFLEYWNSIEQPLVFLKDISLWPLSLYLPSIATDNLGVSFVASVIILLPALLFFLAGQKHLEQGIVASGIKE